MWVVMIRKPPSNYRNERYTVSLFQVLAFLEHILVM